MKRTFIALAFVASAAATLAAGGFGQLPVSARAVTLGGSLAAIRFDPNVVFYNPAGVASLSGVHLSTSYTKLFAGVSGDELAYLSGSAAFGLDIAGNVGVGVTAFRSNAWKEFALTGAYAQPLFEFLSVGGAVKMLNWSAAAPAGLLAVPEDGLSKTTVSFDAGAQVTLRDIVPDNDLVAAVSVRDITQPSIAADGSDDGRLPMNITGGATYVSRALEYLVTLGYTHAGPERRLFIGVEVVAARGSVAGAEVGFVVRGGANRSAGTERYGDLYGGFGVDVAGVTVDYAFGQPSRMPGLAGTHHITLRTSF